MNLSRKVFLYFYQKKQRGGRQVNEYFESSSISDVAFLLLIFFVVTSSFFVPQGIFFQLPSNQKIAQKISKTQAIEINVEQNSYTVLGSSYTGKGLEDYLKEQLKVDKTKIVIIYMSKDLVYDRLIQVFDIARTAGSKKISLKEYNSRDI